MAYLFVFVVYRTDPARVPVRKSTGGLAPHPTHARTCTRAHTHAHAPTRKKTRNKTLTHAHTRAHTYLCARTRTHAHTYAHTWARSYLSIVTFAFCSLRKCYSGEYAPRKFPRNVNQDDTTVRKLHLWNDWDRSFCPFAFIHPSPPIPPKPLPNPKQSELFYIPSKKNRLYIPCKQRTFKKKIKKVYFFFKIYLVVIVFCFYICGVVNQIWN